MTTWPRELGVLRVVQHYPTAGPGLSFSLCPLIIPKICDFCDELYIKLTRNVVWLYLSCPYISLSLTEFHVKRSRNITVILDSTCKKQLPSYEPFSKAFSLLKTAAVNHISTAL